MRKIFEWLAKRLGYGDIVHLPPLTVIQSELWFQELSVSRIEDVRIPDEVVQRMLLDQLSSNLKPFVRFRVEVTERFNIYDDKRIHTAKIYVGLLRGTGQKP